MLLFEGEMRYNKNIRTANTAKMLVTPRRVLTSERLISMATSNLPLPLEFHNGEPPLTVEISLTKGYTAIVDAIDGDLEQYKWYPLAQQGRTVYAVANNQGVIKGRKQLRLHRLVMERVLGRTLISSEQIDHKNGYGLDCQRDNLRIATPNQNARNRKKQSNNTSGYPGVSFHKGSGKWTAQIKVGGKLKYLGLFDTPESAYAIYKQAALEYFGDYTRFE